MCGRYAASRRPEDLVEEFDLASLPEQALPASYNVAPTDAVYAVVERTPRGEPEAEPVRQLRTVRWGLVPSWAKDPSIGSRLINARVESVAEKPAFRKAFAKRRCLLPADGYFEWYGEERGKKQPFFIRPPDGAVLAMAGLYEFWRDPGKDDDDPDAWLTTCTVITTSAPDDLGRIHDRMPMVVERVAYGTWLDPAIEDLDRLTGLLVPAAPGRLTAYPVSKEVSNVRNNGPQLIEPVQIEDAPGPDVSDGPDDEPRLF
jgi:putative SOS response-associated peptidase YedK